MRPSHPKIVLDACGFPCLSWGELQVGLLPVTKVQVETILGRPGSPGSDCYNAGCTVNPRTSWRNPTADRFESLFLTGVIAEEADRLANLYDAACRLPTADEWRLADKCLAGEFDVKVLTRLTADVRVHPAARTILRSTARRANPASGRIIGLFDGGVLEWVGTPHGRYGLYGRTPARLYSILLDPQCHDPARPLTDERNAAFGFRLAYGITPARSTVRG